MRIKKFKNRQVILRTQSNMNIFISKEGKDNLNKGDYLVSDCEELHCFKVTKFNGNVCQKCGGHNRSWYIPYMSLENPSNTDFYSIFEDENNKILESIIQQVEKTPDELLIQPYGTVGYKND